MKLEMKIHFQIIRNATSNIVRNQHVIIKEESNSCKLEIGNVNLEAETTDSFIRQLVITITVFPVTLVIIQVKGQEPRMKSENEMVIQEEESRNEIIPES